MTSEDIDQLVAALDNTSVLRKTTTLELHGPQAALLALLYKLNVVGVRKLSYSVGSAMLSGHKPPPCSIRTAVVSLALDYLQFCPKRMADKELVVM